MFRLFEIFSQARLDRDKSSLELPRGDSAHDFTLDGVSCPVCQFTFPFLQRLYQRYGDSGVTFLGISQDDAKDTASFAREYGATFPMVLDEKDKGYPASNAYGLTNVPTILLIDADGKVRVSSMGFVKDDLERIAAELAQRRKIAPSPLFRPNESVPANKPG